jgi:hypothetical protein
MKITEKNRSLVFLGGTILVGILIIGILMFTESSDVDGVEIVDQPVNTNFKALESKIKNLKTQNFNPSSYNTLATDIDASYQQELLNASAKTNLMSNLAMVYSNLVYSRCEHFLMGAGMDSSSDVISWLNQLEKITAKNKRIDKYRSQINAYNYYSTTLPAKVNQFIYPGITNYNEDKYDAYMKEVVNMPNLDPAYKNKPKFLKIKTELTLALQKFNAKFYTDFDI